MLYQVCKMYGPVTLTAFLELIKDKFLVLVHFGVHISSCILYKLRTYTQRTL